MKTARKHSAKIVEGRNRSEAKYVNQRRGWLTPSLIFGGTVVMLLFCVSVLALFYTPYGPLSVSTSHELLGPSLKYLLGTDNYGRDILSRLMAGTSVTFFSSLGAVAIGGLIGVPAGVFSALKKGATEEVLMRGMDIIYAFPSLLAAVALVAAFGASTTTAMVAVGIAFIPVFARVARGSALSILSQEYVLVARAYGRSGIKILRRHVIPNIMPIMVVQVFLLLSIGILSIAALSYLGLGTPPPAPTWGSMLADAQNYLGEDSLMALWPSLCIAISVLGVNVFGDGLREVLDPTLKDAR